MKTIIKAILAIASLVAGSFIFLIGQMGGEGTAPLPFIWYALLVVFFSLPVILTLSIAKEKKKR